MNMLVSVVMPVFNRADFCEHALKSILRQTYQNREVIVVDDGSTDGSFAVLSRYADQIVLIKNQCNRGQVYARNKGIQIAKGEYIALLDSDDLWDEDKLECYVSAINDFQNPGFIFSDLKRFEWSSGKYYALTNSQLHPFIYKAIHDQFYKRIKAFKIERDVMFEILLRGYPMFNGTFMIKKDLLQTVGFYNPEIKKCTDFDISLKCVQHQDFVYIDRPLTHIGRHDKNMSHDIVEQKYYDVQVMRYHMKNGEYTKKQKQMIDVKIGSRLRSLSDSYLHSGHSDMAKKMLREAASCKRSFAKSLAKYVLLWINNVLKVVRSGLCAMF
jgi:glycosyltransferase involved in cell wall biosynthesis